MGKFIRHVFKTDTLSLIEFSDGYYLRDNIDGLYIARQGKNEQETLIKGLHHYQKHNSALKGKYKDLNSKVENFISQIDRED